MKFFQKLSAWTFLFLLAVGAYAQPGIPATEIQVNTTTANAQGNPSVAMDTAGNIVVVWESYGQDADDYGVYGQLFNPDGTPNGSEIDLNSAANDQHWGQRRPDVAMAHDGSFVVTWESWGIDGDQMGVYRRLFDSSGSSLGSDSRVNSSSSNNSKDPSIACDAAGNFTVVWMDENADGDEFGIYRRRIDNSGSNLESSTLVNATATGFQGMPDIAMDSSGNHVIVWQSADQDGDGMGIYAQIYDNTGSVTVSEFQVNTTTSGNQQEPAVGMDDNGNFVVAWASYNQDGDEYGIYARVYNSSGTAQTSEFLVNSTTSNSQNFPSVAVNREGNFVIAWTSYGTDGNRDGVYLQAYRADGSTWGGQTRVNIRTTDFQQFPSVAWDQDSTSIAIAWQDGLRNSTATHDGDDYGVYANVLIAEDTVPPNPSCQNVTLYLDGTGMASIVAADVDGGSTDEVGVTTYTVNNDSWVCADTGSNFVILTVGDAAGNTAACGATVTVIDSTSPTAVCQNLNVYLDGSGNATITPADLDAGSSDNCGVDSYSASTTSFTCNEAGSNTVTLTVKDVSANSGTCTSTVTVIDSSGPTAVCQNLTVYLDGTGSATITGADVDGGSSDNCSGTLSYGLTQSTFTCSDIGTNSETLTVTDPGGNNSNCSTNITVVDSMSPTAVCNNISVYLNSSGSATITAGDIDGGSSDNCSLGTLSADITSFTCSDVGAVTVTLTVPDANSNSSTCTSTVTVVDSVSPTAVCQNITTYLDGSGSATITAGDIDGGSADACGIGSTSAGTTSFNCANIGTSSSLLTVQDANGNTSTCTATVTVVDSSGPTAVCQSLTVYLDGSGNASITGADVDGGSSDNCSVDSLLPDLTAFTCSNVGTNTVTLTVKDGSNNSSTCTSTVTIADSSAPTAVCNSVTVYLDGSGNASVTAGDADGGSTDNCSISTTAISSSALTCSDVAATLLDTLVVTDVNGNISSCSFAINVLDTTFPTALCQDISVYLDGGGTATITAGDVDAGSSDNCSSTILSVDISSFSCTSIGANTVTLTVSDSAANSSTCTSTVTVVDSTAPTAVCQALTVYLDGSGNASITSGDVDGGSSDNCTVDSLNLDLTSFTCSNTGSNTVTLTVKDQSNNSSTCSTSVIVVDSSAPTAVCQNVTVYLDGTGNATVNAGDADGGSTDNCSISSTAISSSALTCSDVGATLLDTLVVTDVNGNISSCSFAIYVLDTTFPTALCQDVSVYLDGGGTATITAGDVDAGSSDNCSSTILSVDISSFSCTTLGANTVTLTVADSAANSSSCTSTVTVIDSTAPTAVCQALTVYLDGSGNASITSGDVDGGSSDNCTVDSLNLDLTSFTCSNTGSNTVTLTVKDQSNNSSTCSTSVIVVDSTAPTASCQSVTVYLDGTGNATVTAGDADGGSTDNCGISSTSISSSALTCSEVGNTIPDTLVVTDVNGNASSCTFVISVLDTISPTAVCQDISVYLDGTGSATITSGDVDGGSTDNCAGATTQSVDISSFSCTMLGANTVTLTVADSAANSSSCTSTVTVVDSTAPIAVCQALTVYLDGSGNASITSGDVDGGSSDNCTVDSLNLDISSFTCSNTGSNTVTLTVKDQSNNGSTCTSTVTVVDSTSPTASCQSVTIYLDGTGNATVTAGDADGGSTDNCGISSTSISSSALTCSEVGNTILDTLVVTDVNGNASSCTFVISVLDTISPTAVCQDISVYLDGTGSATITSGDVDGGSTDNCAVANDSINNSSFNCGNVGANTVTLTLSDASSNNSSCTATVTVVDSTAPTAICQDVTLYLDASGNGSITPGDVDGGSSDNCSVASTSLSMMSFTCSNVGANTVTLTVLDSNSNASTCTGTVTVVDSVAPTALCQDVTVYLDGSGNGSIQAGDADLGSTDACGVATTVINSNSFTCTDAGNTYTDTLTVIDVNSNGATCAFSIVVEDSTCTNRSVPKHHRSTERARIRLNYFRQRGRRLHRQLQH